MIFFFFNRGPPPAEPRCPLTSRGRPGRSVGGGSLPFSSRRGEAGRARYRELGGAAVEPPPPHLLSSFPPFPEGTRRWAGGGGKGGGGRGGADAERLHGDGEGRGGAVTSARRRAHASSGRAAAVGGRRRRRPGQGRPRRGLRSGTGTGTAVLREVRVGFGGAEERRDQPAAGGRGGNGVCRPPTPAALQPSGSGGRPSGMSYKPIAPAPATPGAASASPAPPGPAPPGNHGGRQGGGGVTGEGMDWGGAAGNPPFPVATSVPSPSGSVPGAAAPFRPLFNDFGPPSMGYVQVREGGKVAVAGPGGWRRRRGWPSPPPPVYPFPPPPRRR